MNAPASSNHTDDRPALLFVLGMGRSGTSALTRVLALCGVGLPHGLTGSDKHNPRGYWEPRGAVYLNEAILRHHRSNWYDPSLRVLENRPLDAKSRSAYLGKIESYLAKLPAAPAIVVKDMRITTLWELWFAAATRAGYRVTAVIALRHPEEVVPSCAKFLGMSPELSSALWLKYTLQAERHTRSLQRVVVEYGNLLTDWKREISRISPALAIDLNDQDIVGLEGFLTKDLHRNRDCGPVTDRFGTSWMSSVYDTMHAAACDRPVDITELDRVYSAFLASESDFRLALRDFDAQTNNVIRKVFRPSVVKPLHAVVAMAHGRKGPWS